MSNQSLPNASMMFGLCDTITMLPPAGGCTPTSLRQACVRRSFSIGGTTRPPSVMSGDATTSPKPSSVPVSTARMEHAGLNLRHRNLELVHRLANRFCERAAVVVELALLGDVVRIEGVGVG